VISSEFKNYDRKYRSYFLIVLFDHALRILLIDLCVSPIIQEQQEIEAELSSQIPELNIEQKLLKIYRRAVALELPEGSTLLEFVRFNVFDFKAIPANGNTQWKPSLYLAFILPADNKKLIIASDGELNLLPFELLPVNNHQYLMDEYTM